MSDDADRAGQLQQDDVARAMDEHKRNRPKFIEGGPGECDNCGQDFARIVHGHCGRCRDDLGIG